MTIATTSFGFFSGAGAAPRTESAVKAQIETCRRILIGKGILTKNAKGRAKISPALSPCFEVISLGLLIARLRRRAPRQRIAEVEKDRVQMRRFRRIRRHIPRVTLLPEVLTHEVDRAVLRIAPDRLVETEADFVERAVHAVGGTGIAITDQAAVGIARRVPSNEDVAPVCIQQPLLIGLFDAFYE